MTQSIDNKIVSRIYGKKRGWVFTPIQFLDLGSRAAVDQALSRLVKKGSIRRVIRGIYDYPRYSDLLDQWLSPDLYQVALVLSQKFGWRIQPSGDTALNLLGLSTQVPSTLVYLSDGPPRTYKVGNRQIVFRRTASKHASLKLSESALIVQALMALGKERVEKRVLKKIRDQFQPSTRKKILKDARVVNGWVYEFIREVQR